MFIRNRCGTGRLRLLGFRSRDFRKTDGFKSLGKGTRNRPLGITGKGYCQNGAVKSEGLGHSH